VPVPFAGYVLVVDAVADRATMRARSRKAARQPVLYQRLYFLLREPVTLLYLRGPGDRFEDEVCG
jgi:hypothetical protein